MTGVNHEHDELHELVHDFSSISKSLAFGSGRHLVEAGSCYQTYTQLSQSSFFYVYQYG